MTAVKLLSLLHEKTKGAGLINLTYACNTFKDTVEWNTSMLKGMKANECGKRAPLSSETLLYKQFQIKLKAMKGDLQFSMERVF